MVLLVPPPQSIAVDALRAALGDQTIDRLPAHVTLVPPVNIPEADLSSALAVLRAAASATAPFGARFGPAATFWPSSPVVMLPCSGGGERVVALRDWVFRAPLLRSLSWQFVPHVTLAPDVQPERIPAVLEAVKGFDCSVTFGSLHLLSQARDLTWAPLASYDLTATPLVIGRGGLQLELVAGDRPDAEAAAWAAGVAIPESPFTISARREGAVVGTATGSTLGAAATLSGLAVDPAVRRQGIGTHLLATVQSLAAERGCGHMTVKVGSEVEAAFYRSRGWRDVGSVPYDGGETVLVRRLSR